MQNKPFALIGVNINCHDPKTLKVVMDKEHLEGEKHNRKRDEGRVREELGEPAPAEDNQAEVGGRAKDQPHQPEKGIRHR
jgi:hypothetical protein